MIDQRSDEWFAARLGKVTASKVADVLATTRSGYAATRTNYMMQLLCERLTGKREEGYTNAAMQRGTDLEPMARSAYEIDQEVMVVETGFIDHPSIQMFGASPDGLVGSDGLVEIKCPNTATHIQFMQTGKPDNKYILQMQTQMICADREWCDFVSFDDRLPENLQYRRVRIMRDDAKTKEIETEVVKFLSELETLIEQLKAA